MSIIDEIFEKREVHELITEIRDELIARRLDRKEYLSKLDDITIYLKKYPNKIKDEEEF